MLDATTKRRLETQHEVIPMLLAGAAPEALDSRPAPGKWSARENLAHIARHHAVFLERLRRILEEETPDLGRYRAEDDPEWPEWSGLPVEEILGRVRSLRGKILAVASGISDDETRRGGIHPLLGNMPLSRWMEFFLLHEAHHLYTVMIRLGEARRPAG
jgi:DinB family protein